MGLFTRSSAAATKPSIPPAITPSDGSDIVPPPGAAAAAAAAAMVSRPPQAAEELPAPAQLSERQLYFQRLKVRIHQQLVERLDVQNLKTLPADIVRAEVRTLIRDLCTSEKGLLSS